MSGVEFFDKLGDLLLAELKGPNLKEIRIRVPKDNELTIKVKFKEVDEKEIVSGDEKSFIIKSDLITSEKSETSKEKVNEILYGIIEKKNTFIPDDLEERVENLGRGLKSAKDMNERIDNLNKELPNKINDISDIDIDKHFPNLSKGFKNNVKNFYKVLKLVDEKYAKEVEGNLSEINGDLVEYLEEYKDGNLEDVDKRVFIPLEEKKDDEMDRISEIIQTGDCSKLEKCFNFEEKTPIEDSKTE